MRQFAIVGAPALLLTFGGAATPDPPAAPLAQYRYVENTGRWVGVFRGEWLLIGKLDKDGEFVHEYRAGRDEPLFGGLPGFVLLNGGGTKSRKAFEFRHGTLTPGELRKDGAFVPEVGGKIIAFADYTYTPDAPRIWNLPGGFVPVEPPAKK